MRLRVLCRWFCWLGDLVGLFALEACSTKTGGGDGQHCEDKIDCASPPAPVWYDDWTPNGAARLSAMFSGCWDGQGVIVEVDLASKNWDDAYPNVPDIVHTANIPAFQFVEMDGTAMGLGIPRQQDTPITLRWDRILPNLVDRSYLIGPQNGWSTADTSSCTLSNEVRNDTSSCTVSAELRFTNFRISGQ